MLGRMFRACVLLVKIALVLRIHQDLDQIADIIFGNQVSQREWQQPRLIFIRFDICHAIYPIDVLSRPFYHASAPELSDNLKVVEHTAKVFIKIDNYLLIYLLKYLIIYLTNQFSCDIKKNRIRK